MKMKGYCACLVTLGVVWWPAACQQVQPELLPEDAEKLAHLQERLEKLEDAVPDEPEGFAPATYEHFVTRHAYPRSMTIYHNDAQMEQATAENAHVVISLFHQRGRLYVDDAVVADWPVSTGVEGRATTPGEYKVLEKKKDHASGRFGVIKSESGKTLVADADSRKHTVPEGAVWEGSPMPNWMRLTDYGMGMHTGEVKPGTCLSHGCIRMPDFIATRLFEMMDLGWRVVVVDELEDYFPAKDALQASAPYNTWLYEKMALEREIEKLTKAAEKRAAARARSAHPTAETPVKEKLQQGEKEETEQPAAESPVKEQQQEETEKTEQPTAETPVKEQQQAEKEEAEQPSASVITTPPVEKEPAVSVPAAAAEADNATAPAPAAPAPTPEPSAAAAEADNATAPPPAAPAPTPEPSAAPAGA